MLRPDWWCKEFEQREGAIFEVAAYIARGTGLEFSDLINEDWELSLPSDLGHCFKKRQGTEDRDLVIAVRNFPCRQIWNDLTKLIKIQPILNGEDLKKLGYKPGPQFKIILEALLIATLDQEIGDRISAELFLKQYF